MLLISYSASLHKYVLESRRLLAAADIFSQLIPCFLVVFAEHLASGCETLLHTLIGTANINQAHLTCSGARLWPM